MPLPPRTEERPPASRPALLQKVAALAAVVAALGLAAAVVGVPGEPSSRVPLGVPGVAVALGADALTGALLGAGIVLLLLALWTLATAPRAKVRVRRPWWHSAITLGLLAILTLLLSWSMARGWLAEGLERLVASQEWLGGASDVDPLTGPGAGEQALDPSVRQAVAVAGVVVVLIGGAVGAWWWLYRGGQGDTGTAPEDGATGRLAEAVDAALHDLEGDLDPRRAILRCYAHLEAALAACGVPRRAAETAREHRHRAAETLGLGARAAARLVDRFEQARYHDGPVSEAQRQEAEAALRAVRAALQGEPAGSGRP